MSTPDAPEEITVTVTYEGGPSAHVVWTRGLSFRPYEIASKLLSDMSNEVRDSLDRLIDKCMADGVASCGAELRAVAVSGHRLYKALFTKTGGVGNADKIKNWFTEKPAGSRLLFAVPKLVHVPWGLIFDKDPRTLKIPEGSTDIDFYGHFWCLKYNLATTYYTLTPDVLEAPPRPAALFRLLSVVNRETHDAAKKLLSPAEREVQGWLESDFPPALESRRGLLDEWLKADDVDLLYFYCHADGTSIDVGDEHPITTNDFMLELTRPEVQQDSSYCMVFLNGCSTAAGAPGGGFLEATGGAGYCGFIGPEVEIPDVFALRFGLAFLYYFLKRGWPVYQIMDHLRKKHWPLGLVYSACCNPLLRVDTSGAEVGAEIEFNNFSELPLGTGGPEDARI